MYGSNGVPFCFPQNSPQWGKDTVHFMQSFWAQTNAECAGSAIFNLASKVIPVVAIPAHYRGEENGGGVWETLGSGGECHTQSPTSLSFVKPHLHGYTNCKEGEEMWFTSMRREKERINVYDLMEDSAKYSKDLL